MKPPARPAAPRPPRTKRHVNPHYAGNQFIPVSTCATDILYVLRCIYYVAGYGEQRELSVKTLRSPFSTKFLNFSCCGES